MNQITKKDHLKISKSTKFEDVYMNTLRILKLLPIKVIPQ
jgi:hypothetical protein